MISKDYSNLSIVWQSKLLQLHRSGFYYRPKDESELNLELMRLMDAHYSDHPSLARRACTPGSPWTKDIRPTKSGSTAFTIVLWALGPLCPASIPPGARGHKNISVPVAKYERPEAQPGMGHRYHLYPHEKGISVSTAIIPAQQVCGQLVGIQYHGCKVVQGNFGRGHSVTREAGDYQYRPGKPIHLRGIRKLCSIEKYKTQYGWKRKGVRQCVHRTPMEKREIRNCLLESPGVRNRLYTGKSGIISNEDQEIDNQIHAEKYLVKQQKAA